MSACSRSLPSDAIDTGRGSIFVPVSRNFQHLSSTLVCSVTSLFCSVLTSDTTGVMNPGLSMTASQNLPMNSGEFKAFCTVWSINVSKSADTQLLTPFRLAVSVSSTNLFNASSTCIGMTATASSTRSCSLVRGATAAASVFFGRSSEAN